MKVASYQESTAPDGSGVRLSYLETRGEAALIFNAIDAMLSPSQRAWLDLTYDGAGEAKIAAVDALCLVMSGLSRNQALLRLVIMRSSVFGESFCPNLSEIARAAGASPQTCWNVDKRVSRAMQALSRETRALLRAEFERRGWLTRA